MSSGKIKNWFNKEKIKQTLIDNADKPLASKLLALISFAESSFFPIPPDPFLAGLVVVNYKKWLRFSFIVTAFSVLGGLFGYAIGYFFFEWAGQPLVNLYNLHEQLQNLGQVFENNSFLAIFLAAFTPIPYKVFTIAAGLFHINIFIFTIASIVGRGLRFFVLGFIMRFVGEKFGSLIFRYINLIMILVVIFALIYITIF